jgi:hypothetical protein
VNPIVLASSPLVGPGAMQAVADGLRRHGRHVDVPEVPADLDEFAASLGTAVRPDSVVVGFSAAGPRLFHAAAAARPAGIVFLDARLPADGVPPDAPPEFADFLDTLPVVDGLLPPWPEWWPDAIAELIPDAEQRATFASGCPSVERAMFSRPIPAPPFDGPCGFVGLGDGYAADADEARRRGWPVAVVDEAHHLWPVTEPDAVAAAVAAMIDRLAA